MMEMRLMSILKRQTDGNNSAAKPSREQENKSRQNMRTGSTKTGMDMINGSMADKILLFALPLAVTGILQQMFNAADVAVVGQFAGNNAMAAVGSNAPVIGLLVNMFIGVSLGANVVISRYTGQQNEEGISRAVHTAVLVALLSGIGMGLLGELIAAPMIRLLGVPEEVFPLSLAYLRIYLAGLPVILLYNFEAAIFRSQGDTRTPLMCLVISGLINVVLNLFFVIVAGMTADGVALATVISNLISSGLMFILLLRSDTAIRIRPSKMRISHGELLQILRIGIPAGLQSMVFSISNLCIQSAVNSLGAIVMAASSAAFNLEIFSYYLVNAFGQACTTFTGQNYGANRLDRCRRVLRITLGMNMIFTVDFSTILILFRYPLLRIFNTDPQVLQYGSVRMFFILSAEAVNVLIETFSGGMRGYGFSLGPALASVIGICGTRILWVLTVFRRSRTFATLMMAYPISWSATALAMILLYNWYIRYHLRPEHT